MKNDVDILNREKFIDTVVNIVENLAETDTDISFAIDGGWGYGKTFVLERIEERLEEIQSEKTNSDKYIVFHYNCWEYDYYDEPLMAFASALQDMIITKSSLFDEKMAKNVRIFLKAATKKLLLIPNAIIKNHIGVDIKGFCDEMKEIKKEDSEFDSLSNLKEAIQNIKKALEDIGKGKKIISCIDEIDRCLPPYQIKILERLHHLFQGENIISIFSVNRSQLTETVKQLYGGNDKRVDNYLKKFISFSLSLDKGDLDDHAKEKFSDCLSLFDNTLFNDDFNLIGFLHSIFPEMDIRRQEKLWEKVKLVHSMTFHRKVGYDILAYELLWFVMQEYTEYYFFNPITSLPEQHNPQIPPFELLSIFCKGELSTVSNHDTLLIPQPIANFFKFLATQHSKAMSIEGKNKIFTIASNSSLYTYLLAYWLDSCSINYKCSFLFCGIPSESAYSQEQYHENLSDLQKFRDIARAIEY